MQFGVCLAHSDVVLVVLFVCHTHVSVYALTVWDAHFDRRESALAFAGKHSRAYGCNALAGLRQHWRHVQYLQIVGEGSSRASFLS